MDNSWFWGHSLGFGADIPTVRGGRHYRSTNHVLRNRHPVARCTDVHREVCLGLVHSWKSGACERFA
jgi:hypothetical protein